MNLAAEISQFYLYTSLLVTVEIVGQDTSANAITWMVKFVGENQEVFNYLMVSQKLISLPCFSLHSSEKVVIGIFHPNCSTSSGI